MFLTGTKKGKLKQKMWVVSNPYARKKFLQHQKQNKGPQATVIVILDTGFDI